MRVALALMLLVTLTAIGVVYAKHRARLLFVEMKTAEREVDALQTEWGRLRLEQNTWAERGRIERIARTRLGMKLPEKDQIRFLSDKS